MTDKNEDNLVMFPGTVKIFTRRGRAALSENNGDEALAHFQRALTIAPDYYQARFGEVLSYMKLERNQDALVCTQCMLQEGIGNYFDILHLHITLLVNLAKFNEIISILESLLSEGQIPAKYAESFYDTLHFARGMSENLSQLEDFPVDNEPPEDLLKQLKSENRKEQWNAIQLLSKEKHDLVILEFKNFLEVEKNELIYKTVVLRALKDMEVTFSINIKKRGQMMEVIPNDLEDIFEDSFAKQVENKICEMLEHNNPSLKDGAVQIWWHYFFAVYPFELVTANVNLWAAGANVIGLESFGMDFDENEIATDYHVELEDLLDTVNEMNCTQNDGFQEFDV
jgi:tetratricopeptide (TPR) repeat protein